MAHAIGAVHVRGRALHCLICAHDMFWERELLLSSSMLSLFTMDEGSRAHCAVCARCGYAHMFIPPATIPIDAPSAAGGPLPEPAA